MPDSERSALKSGRKEIQALVTSKANKEPSSRNSGYVRTVLTS